ncbi:MAG TPA: hypothetical protein IAA38_06230, partial [Candidatus Ruminococcus gallistercoris]|nr:hypothetical protein [Candidatus Ruminococcus gallistercoris]
ARRKWKSSSSAATTTPKSTSKNPIIRCESLPPGELFLLSRRRGGDLLKKQAARDFLTVRHCNLHFFLLYYRRSCAFCRIRRLKMRRRDKKAKLKERF